MDKSLQYTISGGKESRFLAVGDTVDQKSFLKIEGEDQAKRNEVLLKRAEETVETIAHLQKSLEGVISYLKGFQTLKGSAKLKMKDQEVRDIENRLTISFDSINTANKCLTDISPNMNQSSSASALRHEDQELKNNYNFLMTGKIIKIQDLLTDLTPIGHGGEGRVFRGKLRGSGQPVVVKSYFLDCEQSSRLEFAIMTLAKKVLGVKRPIALVNTPTNFFLIMEDELNTVPLDAFVAMQRVTDSQIQCIFSQMVRILYDLNEKFIKHRDIKLENFLLNVKTGRLSIIDFGWSMYTAIDHVTIDEVRKSGETLMGTTDYLPPENNSPLGTTVSYEKATVYALGCILLELFFGYQGKLNKMMPPKGISGLLASLALKTGQKVSKGAHSLLDKCTRTDPNERLSLEGVLNHPWVPADRRDLHINKCRLPSSRHKFKSYEL